MVVKDVIKVLFLKVNYLQKLEYVHNVCLNLLRISNLGDRMKRQGGKNKKKCQQIHFRRRCTERLGFVPSGQELKRLIERIRTAKSQFIEKQSNRVTVWRDYIEEIDVILIYDKVRKQIVTIMPYSWWKEQQKQKVG